MALVMTFFNIRLGWWAPNPMWLAGRKPLLRQEPLYGLAYVLKEAFSGTNRHSNWLYLSDGGHFDNLGLYEMVRRRCRHIVVVDSGCDGEFKYADLHNAIRKIAVDLAVPIDLDADLPGQKGPAERKRIAVGTIGYSALDPTYRDGRLYVVKPVLVGDEPPALREYAEVSRRNGKTFPHHSTADQFFNETQFESYRRLGEWSVRALLDAINGIGGKLPVDHAGTPAPAVLPPPLQSERPDPPPPARSTGLVGIQEGVRALTPVQMFAGALATAGAVGAAVTVGHEVTVRAVDAVSPSTVGKIPVELDPATKDLLKRGVVVNADPETLDRIEAVKTALAELLKDWPPPVVDDRETIEEATIIAEIQKVTTLLETHARQPARPGSVTATLDSSSLAGITGRLDRLDRVESRNGEVLAVMVTELRKIAARLQDSNPRRNVRGS
jgi:hypothetical protein